MGTAEQGYHPLPEQLGFSGLQTTVSVWKENFPGSRGGDEVGELAAQLPTTNLRE